jgi:hypothetical protein
MGRDYVHFEAIIMLHDEKISHDDNDMFVFTE